MSANSQYFLFFMFNKAAFHSIPLLGLFQMSGITKIKS